MSDEGEVDIADVEEEIRGNDGAMEEDDDGLELGIGDGGDEQQEVVTVENDSIAAFLEHKDSLFAVAINPVAEDMVATGGGDDLAYVWRISNDEGVVAKLEDHSDSVTSVSFSRDRRIPCNRRYGWAYQDMELAEGSARVHP